MTTAMAHEEVGLLISVRLLPCHIAAEETTCTATSGTAMPERRPEGDGRGLVRVAQDVRRESKTSGECERIPPSVHCHIRVRSR